MSPTEVLKALEALIPARVCLYLWGSPGVGKSSVVRQATATLKLQLVDIRATLLDPVDLRGLPKVTGKKTEWCPPMFLPTSGKGVLFLDELAQAVPNVQSSLLQLTLDRRIGEYELPDGWTVVAASNRAEDRAGCHRLIAPLSNRFVHLDFDVSPEDFQNWAVATCIAPEVRAFLRFRPSLLLGFKPESNPRAFPTPRSWEFVSEVLKVTPPHLLQRVVAGCVGEGAAAEFIGYLKLYRDLPDIDAVLANPTTTALPKEPAVLYSLVGALTERCRTTPTLVPNFAKLAMRLPDEFSMLALRDAIALNRSLISDKSVQTWIAQARGKGLFIAA